MVISYKFRRHICVDDIFPMQMNRNCFTTFILSANSIRTGLAATTSKPADFLARSRCSSIARWKARLVQDEALFARGFGNEVDRKAIGIVEFEDSSPAKIGRFADLGFEDQIVQNRQALDPASR